MKRNYLGVSLRGAAQALLHDVGSDCVTYNDLVKFLLQRFSQMNRGHYIKFG